MYCTRRRRFFNFHNSKLSRSVETKQEQIFWSVWFVGSLSADSEFLLQPKHGRFSVETKQEQIFGSVWFVGSLSADSEFLLQPKHGRFYTNQQEVDNLRLHRS